MNNIYIHSNALWALVWFLLGQMFCLHLSCSIFPSPEQNPGLSHYQGLLNTGGSLPDLSNLHFPSPLSTPLDPEDNGGYPNLSGGSSTGNLPAAMMHLGIGNSQGGWSFVLPCVGSLPVCLGCSQVFDSWFAGLIVYYVSTAATVSVGRHHEFRLFIRPSVGAILVKAISQERLSGIPSDSNSYYFSMDKLITFHIPKVSFTVTS